MTIVRRAILLTAALLLLLLVSHVPTIVADEVKLTNEWQLLGENDTVPAGAHIRMDLSTGGRWAKLNTDDGDQDNDQVEIDSSGGIVASVNKEDVKKEPEFDYDMMHRALSHLPEEEKERMGGLPELPEAGADPETVKAFQDRMKEIWTQRQAELKQLQEESLADLPKLLLERIKSIDAYLQDPQSELSQEWKDDKQERVITNVLSVLQDLEGHFSDIDMTRDFKTLGGWPLLVSLLSDNVHTSPNATLTPEQLEKVQDIQSQAAWAIGSAVKNIGEFVPWATEELSIDGVKTTLIDLLLDQLKQNYNSVKKNQKILYAIGSLLRGNRMAQAHFCVSGGPAVLETFLPSDSQGEYDPKTVKRILALADDVVSDVVLHPYEQNEDVDRLIVQSFSTDAYCKSCVRLLGDTALQETALETVQALVPFCTTWDKDTVRSAVTKVKEESQSEDDEHLRELADELLSEL